MVFRFHEQRNRVLLAVLLLFHAPLLSCRSMILSPFGAEGQLKVAMDNSVMTVLNHRVRPQATVTGKRVLTLEDCKRLALSNNLDLQAARLEELTQRAIRYSNQTRLLPHFICTGELSERDNQRFSYSDVLGAEGRPPSVSSTATGVTSFSVGHERSTWLYVLETRWSPTDAALAYYVTKSSVNDTMKAHYQRVRVAQKLVEVVEAAYYRLLAHQESLALAEKLVSLRKDIQYKMDQLLQDRLVKVEDFQRVEQKAERARRVLSRIRTDIEVERNILASSMALSPDYCVDGGFQVVGNLSRPTFSAEICEMEMTAVRRRPEAYQSGLVHMNSVNDLRRTIVKYFPRITGFWRFSRDKDKFLYNKDWKDVGISIYFDLVEWLANSEESKASEIKAEKTQREIGAVALGITSQVRVAALKYSDGLEELASADSSVTSLTRILMASEARLHMQDTEKVLVEETKGDLMEAKIQRFRALGEANANLATLQSSMGNNYYEPKPH